MCVVGMFEKGQRMCLVGVRQQPLIQVVVSTGTIWLGIDALQCVDGALMLMDE